MKDCNKTTWCKGERVIVLCFAAPSALTTVSKRFFSMSESQLPNFKSQGCMSIIILAIAIYLPDSAGANQRTSLYPGPTELGRS